MSHESVSVAKVSCPAGLQRFAKSDGDSSAAFQAGPANFKASAHAAAMMEFNLITNGLQSLQIVRSCLFKCRHHSLSHTPCLGKRALAAFLQSHLCRDAVRPLFSDSRTR
jgi:hypothetical protein